MIQPADLYETCRNLLDPGAPDCCDHELLLLKTCGQHQFNIKAEKRTYLCNILRINRITGMLAERQHDAHVM